MKLGHNLSSVKCMVTKERQRLVHVGQNGGNNKLLSFCVHLLHEIRRIMLKPLF